MPLKPTHAATAGQRDQAFKGRGASLNLEGRFERWSRIAFEELDAHEWATGEGGEGGDDQGNAAAPPTQVSEEVAKSIISTNDSPDVGFRYSVNPYRDWLRARLCVLLCAAIACLPRALPGIGLRDALICQSQRRAAVARGA
jgi:hypothetical protein